MGSGASYDDYKGSFERVRGIASGDETVKKAAYAARGERVGHAKATVMDEKPAETREVKADPSKVRLKITKPSAQAKRIHVILVDNSGSNARIARHMRDSSSYIAAVHGQMDPESDFAMVFFSDHCDGARLMQEVDYVSPTPEGDEILLSTIANVYAAHGGDEAEAIECALLRACELDFGAALTKHLYLVSDQVAHGMGESSDDGCPLQVDWRKSLENVMKTYDTFEIVGCGSRMEVANLQKKFISPERLAFDFVDLSAIEEVQYRLGITPNAFLFLVARKHGMQAVELFLSFLYEKWLASPIFGANTELRANEAIRRFGKYLEYPEEEIKKMMDRVLI